MSSVSTSLFIVKCSNSSANLRFVSHQLSTLWMMDTHCELSNFRLLSRSAKSR